MRGATTLTVMVSMVFSAHIGAAHAAITPDPSQTLTRQQTSCEVDEQQARQASITIEVHASNVGASTSPPPSQSVVTLDDTQDIDSIRDLRAAVDEAITPTALGDARFLLAEALLREGEGEAAVVIIDQALEARRESGTTLTDHLWLMRGKALATLGRHSDARRSFKLVRRSAQTNLAIEATWAEAQLLAKQNRTAAALKTYRTLLKTWPDAVGNLDVRMEMAELEAARGRHGRARALYRHVVRLAPKGDLGAEAQRALDTMARSGHVASTQENFGLALEDARWLVRERRFDDALSPVDRLWAWAQKLGERELKLDVLELKARIAAETERPGDALAMHARLKKQGRSVFGKHELSRLHAFNGDWEGAELALRGAYGTARAYWRALGKLYARYGRYDVAERWYRKSIGKGKRRKYAKADDLANLAWAVARQGKADEALPLFEEVQKKNRKKSDWARYWSGRVLQDVGRTDEAVVYFSALSAEAPFTYYGLQSTSRLEELERTKAQPNADIATAATPALEVQPTRPSTVAWPENPLNAAFEDSFAAAEKTEREKTLATFAMTWGKWSAEARRAYELTRLGKLDEAAAELRVIDADLRAVRKKGWGSLAKRTRSDLLDKRSDKRGPGGIALRRRGRRSRQQARAFYLEVRNSSFKADLRKAQVALGDAYALRRSVFESGRLGNLPTEQSMERWRNAYPIAFVEHVRAETTRRDVPVYFLYSLMKVESAFHPGAISVSNAYGLLQVIPRTGRRVASELSVGNFVPERLLTPQTAIQMGTYYVGRLLGKFQGQEPLAAAAYNAGPHRVSEWLRANPNRPMDVFIDEIPYGQARRYTRSVLKHAARYRRIYHGDATLYVTNQLRASHEPEPNY